MNNKVTICVSLCNNAKWIKRCVDSILTQTYQNIEVIVVDDGSIDGSGDVCKQYQEIIYYWKENDGLSSARQKGLELSTGDYICFIDADDFLAPTYVEHLIEKIITSGTDICVCSTLFVNEEGEEIPEKTNAYHCRDEVIVHLDSNNINTSIISNLFLSDSWNKMYSKKFLQKCGVRFSLPKGFNGSDLAFNNKLALYMPSYSFVSTNEYIHVIYEKSAVHRRRKKLQEGFEIIIDDIIKQSQAVDMPTFDVYISNLYYRLLRKSFQDVLNENLQTNEKDIAFGEMLREHKSFVQSRKEIKGKSSLMFTRSLAIFAFICDKTPLLVKPYLLLRRRLTTADS